MNNPLAFFPARIAIGDIRGTRVFMTTEFYRALQDVLRRLGGSSSEVPDLDQLFMENIMAPAAGMDSDAASMFGDMLTQQGHGSSEGSTLNDPAFAGMQVSPQPELIPEAPVLQPAHQEQCGLEMLGQPQIAGSPMPFRALAATASPMAITADQSCAIHIDGAVDQLTYSRAGTDLDLTGAPIIEMNLGDMLTVTYTVPPILTFIPR